MVPLCWLLDSTATGIPRGQVVVAASGALRLPGRLAHHYDMEVES